MPVAGFWAWRLKLVRRIAQRTHGRFQAGHVSVMVGAPNINQAGKAALKLILMIGNIRREFWPVAGGERAGFAAEIAGAVSQYTELHKLGIFKSF